MRSIIVLHRLRRAQCAFWVVMALALVGCPLPRTAPVPDAQFAHADFYITTDVLEGLVVDLPQTIQTQIMRLPEYFVELLYGALVELPAEYLQLLDKEHALPAEYIPDGLVALDAYNQVLTLTRRGMFAHQALIPDLLAMSAAAMAEGIPVPISSAYRSYDHQQRIYENSIFYYGERATSESVAVPGHSQHQLGVALDFGTISDDFLYTPEGQWLFMNGWQYGFSLSYPEGGQERTGYRFESWHYRYIGRSAAKLERNFFFGSQQILLEFIDEHRSFLDALLVPIENAR